MLGYVKQEVRLPQCLVMMREHGSWLLNTSLRAVKDYDQQRPWVQGIKIMIMDYLYLRNVFIIRRFVYTDIK